MKILRIPTFWSAEEADTIYEFLGELRSAVWQEYNEDIQAMHDDISVQTQKKTDNEMDDDVDF